MDYAEEGDLLHLIQKRKKSNHFSEQTIWEYAWQLCLAILHIHANGIVHRDIKASNILWTKETEETEPGRGKGYTLKLTDLGESSELSETKFMKGKIVGTPLFLSPEVIRHDNYDHRVDIWALGWVLYHLATLEPPFSGSSHEILMNAIQFKTLKPLRFFSKKLKIFIGKMLEKQKIRRPFIVELFGMFPSGFKLEREIDVSFNWIFNFQQN